MKQGLFLEDGVLIYYENGVPKHAGLICEDGDYYYISSHGRAVTGTHVVHGEMTNGLLERGTYRFGDDYKMIPGSYIPPRSKKKPLTKRIKRYLKKKKYVLPILSVLLVIGAFTVLIQTAKEEETATADVSQNTYVFLPEFKEDVLLCSTAAKMEYDGLLSLTEAINYGDPYRPFLFEYHFRNTSGTLLLSENSDFVNHKSYTLAENATYVAIDNLYVDKTYYYKVLVEDQEYTGSFHTAPSTRFVHIPGLVNTRDIGGIITLDGKTVKQGLLIRGVEIDGLVNAAYYIRDEELSAVKDAFGFVYDMDLRSPTIYYGDYQSRWGISHKFYDACQYGMIFQSQYHESLRQIFADLADPDKYPMYLHCTWGQDRTGTVIFLLQGILNVSQEEMVREYRLTSYTNKSLVESRNMDVVIDGLQMYAGDTIQEKIVTFLTEVIGVTNEEIESIRKIYLE